MRAAIYARSAIAGGCDKQLRQLRTYVVRRSWDDTGEYIDDGVSGLSVRRLGLDQLLADAAQGQFECVVISDVARLSRNTGELLRQIKHFADAGVKVIAADQNVDGRQDYRLLQFLAGFGTK